MSNEEQPENAPAGQRWDHLNFNKYKKYHKLKLNECIKVNSFVMIFLKKLIGHFWTMIGCQLITLNTDK